MLRRHIDEITKKQGVLYEKSFECAHAPPCMSCCCPKYAPIATIAKALRIPSKRISVEDRADCWVVILVERPDNL
jgi:hypothetical protein